MKKKSILCAPLALIIVVITSLLFGGMAVSADGETSGSCGEDATWEYANGTLTISGSGDMTDHPYSPSDYPWYQYKNDITTVVIGNDITYIACHAFYGYGQLSSVSLGNKVGSIGESAFYGCTTLSTVTLNEGLTSIGNYAFSGCRLLTSVQFPDTLNTLGTEAFYGSGLTSISLPDGIKYIGRGAFCCCSGLTAVTVNLTSEMTVGNQMFSGCSNLTQASITGTLTALPDSTFDGCESLTSVTIPDTVTRINREAFMGCKNLTSFTIPANVTLIGERAFNGCTSLSSISIPAKVQYICSSAFSESGLSSVEIKDGVGYIEDYAFAYCNNLTSVTIPGSVDVIGRGAFSNCPALTSVTINEGVTCISEYAFESSGIKSIVVPKSVVHLYEAFRNCTNLKKLEVLGDLGYVGPKICDRCEVLETVILPSKINNLENPQYIPDLLGSCYALKKVYCHSSELADQLINRCPGKEIVVIGEEEKLEKYVVGHSLTLSADIAVNFYLNLPEGYDINNTEVTFTWGDESADYLHTAKKKLVAVDEYGAKYKVTCGVAARAMGDDIKMVVTSGGEELITNTYSVIEYIEALGRSLVDDNLKNMLSAMVIYGSYSQNYFKYRTDSNVIYKCTCFNSASYMSNHYTKVSEYIGDLYDEYTDNTETYECTIKNIANDDLGIAYYGASVLCSSETKMRFYFTVTDEAKFADLKASSNGLTFHSKTLSTPDGDVETVYIETPGLFAGALKNPIGITIGGNTYTYDYRDYMKRCSSNFKGIAVALYAFSDYANKYQGG